MKWITDRSFLGVILKRAGWRFASTRTTGWERPRISCALFPNSVTDFISWSIMVIFGQKSKEHRAEEYKKNRWEYLALNDPSSNKLPDRCSGIISLLSLTPRNSPRTRLWCKMVPNGSLACKPTWLRSAFDNRTICKEAVATVLRRACWRTFLSASECSSAITFWYSFFCNLADGWLGGRGRWPLGDMDLLSTRLSTSREVTLKKQFQFN